MDLQKLKKEFENELTDNILKFWVEEVYDIKRHTFNGRVANDGTKFPDAPLSAVFITRIVWTFSAAYQIYPTAIYKKMADEAFRILTESFWDNENGGIYWSVFPDGKPQDTKKQFYAEAFCIYALSEYHLAFQSERAKQLAISLFMLMEKYAYDPKFGGYFEATTADWQRTGDLQITPGISEIKKSMNTSLHILEAYTNFFRIWKDESLKKQLHAMIRIFLDKIINPETWHFHLFFGEDWTVHSEIDSYGHDIEGSWLLLEAAEVLGDEEVVKEVKQVAIKMADVTKREAFSKNNGMYYEKDEHGLKEQFDWWPQAESVVGFFNAWQISLKQEYFDQSLKSWKFIGDYIIDRKNGEWFLGVDKNLKPLNSDKVSGWKAPYHNGRMCMEMMRRIDKIIND